MPWLLDGNGYVGALGCRHRLHELRSHRVSDRSDEWSILLLRACSDTLGKASHKQMFAVQNNDPRERTYEGHYFLLHITTLNNDGTALFLGQPL